ncbi:MAG: hypothetical protein IPL65_22380 [Lewinellaceae bacterium]|nr:hypothetical protein [Lewinellaceae bacterium]
MSGRWPIPFYVWFQGWLDRLRLTTVHIYYGEAVAEDPDRVKERRNRSVCGQTQRKNRAPGPTTGCCCDFGFCTPTDVTMKAITAANFKYPRSCQNLPSNVAQVKVLRSNCV